jgi:hypothetical protein
MAAHRGGQALTDGGFAGRMPEAQPGASTGSGSGLGEQSVARRGRAFAFRLLQAETDGAPDRPPGRAESRLAAVDFSA